MHSKLLLILALGAVLVTGPLPARQTGTDAAVAALAEFDTACEEIEQLWSLPLCGPIVLVNPETRKAVTNQPDPDGAFAARESAWVGDLPAEVPIANTAFEWDDRNWAMVMLPLPSERFARLQLLAHESFHRIQPELGHEPNNAMAMHLDEEMGRVWLRLELRALSRAVESEGPEAAEAAADALLFRAVRHRLFPDTAGNEARLERHEGLAEYSGVRFALDATGEGLERVADLSARFEKRPTYVRSLGYGTGPLLGLLLDRYDPDWRQRSVPDDLAARLATTLPGEAIALDTPDTESAWQRAANYDVESVRTEESERAARIAEQRARYREELVEGPVLHVELPERRLMFNPNTVLALGDHGTVYPGAILLGPWGRLKLDEGAALATDERARARVAAPKSLEPETDGTVHGPGWTLELNQDWRLVPGDRPGDVRFAEKP